MIPIRPSGTDAGLGQYPTLGGDPSTNIPSTPTSTTPTSTTPTTQQQSAIASSQQSQQRVFLAPPPPLQPDGKLTLAMYIWLQKLYLRVGGSSVLSSSDLQTLEALTDSIPQHSKDNESIEWISRYQSTDSSWSLFQERPDQSFVHKLNNEIIRGQKSFTDTIVIPKDILKGIEIDPLSPSYAWKDLKGEIHVDSIGPTSPAWSNVNGHDYGWKFTVNDEVWNKYHVDHDWAYQPSYIHAHWLHNSSLVTGGYVIWCFEITAAKGHNQESFGPEIVINVMQTASITNEQHMIAEVQMSTPGGILDGASANYSITSGAAVLTSSASAFTQADVGRTIRLIGAGAAGGNLDTTVTSYTNATSITLSANASTTLTASANAYKYRVIDDAHLEPDSLIKVHTFLRANSMTVSSGGIPEPFLDYVDIHYQSTNIGTKQKAPNFYV